MRKLFTILFFCAVIYPFQVSAQQLSKVGTGIPGAYINDLTLFNGKLYAGGYFTPGVTAKDHVYSFNGNQWESMKGGVNSANFFAFIKAFAEFDNKLFMCGGFESAGTFATEDIGIWNGTDWEDPKGGVPSAYSMQVFGNKLYVGAYTVKGGWIKPFWEWTGSGWQQHPDSFNLGSNADSHVAGMLTMYEYGGKLIVGGLFNQINGTPVNNIAAWDGNTWQPLGDGVAGQVRALQEWNGDLYVGGNFDSAGGVPTKFMAKWNGTSWSAVNTTFDQRVEAFGVYNGNLWVGGQFFTPNRGVVKYDGQNFTVPFVPDNGVNKFLNDGNSLLFAGSFQKIDGVQYSLLARYNEEGAGLPNLSKGTIGVYPNPTAGVLQISPSNLIEGTAILTVYDNLGRKVIEKEIQNSDEFSLPVGNLPEGAYHIILLQRTALASGSFIKQ